MCAFSACARVCALTALLVALSFASANQIGHAQSEPPPLTPWRGFTENVSLNANGWPSGTADVGRRYVSGDGRYVVFTSDAYDLIPGEYTTGTEVFLRDRTAGTTTRLSVPIDGQDWYDIHDDPTISTDGRHVAFASSAANLVAGDTNNVWDVFVRDLDAARTVRVSVAADGTQADGGAYRPVISANGRFVGFISEATTLVPGSTPVASQAYVHDRDVDGNGTFDEPGGISTTRVSVSSNGVAADAFVEHLTISGDGRFVTFETRSANLDPVVTDGSRQHLYMRDLLAGETWLVDRAVTGGPSTEGVQYTTSDLSDDGRYVTYSSDSTDIVPFPYYSPVGQIYRYDRLTNTTTIVTALPDGTLANSWSSTTAVTGDGRYVAFVTTATNLGSAPVFPDRAAVVVRDMVDGGFTRVDMASSGSFLDQMYVYLPAISADGTVVAFQSDASTLEGNPVGMYHVLVAAAFSVSTTAVSHPMEGASASIDVNTSPVTGWNAASLDPWIVLTEGAGFGAGPRTVHYSVEPNSAGIVRDGRIKIGGAIILIHQAGDGDETPPVITPIVTGTRTASGWYTSDITLQWSVTDPDSEIVEMSPGCAPATFTSDFMYAMPTCEALSHGGRASASIMLRRDTTPPLVSVSSPQQTIYPRGAAVNLSYSCADASGYSGVASCTATPTASPINTTTPGRHVVTARGTDRAGNSASKSVEYLIGTDACVTPSITPGMHMQAWWRFDGDTRDTVRGRYAYPQSGGGFENAVVKQGWASRNAGNYLRAYDDNGPLHITTSRLTVAMWVRPFGQFGESGTLVSKPAQYRIARYPDGTLRWAFNQTTGYTWVNTGVVIPANVWSHVAVTYKDGWVQSYLNGRLLHSQQLEGSLTSSPTDSDAPLTIAGRDNVNATLFGTIDDLLIFDEALPSSDVENIALAGSGSLCVPYKAKLTLTAPSTVGYGSSFPVSAVLTDEAGTPLANRDIMFSSYIGPGGGLYYGWNTKTDANGYASGMLQASSSATLGDYPRGIRVSFPGDASYSPASAEASTALVAGTPKVTWPQPAPIVFGTALDAAQLNASANVEGTFEYSPPAGAMLSAGTHTLTVTFTPSDSTRWQPTSGTTTIVVNKAVPTVTATGGMFTYDKQPHAGSGIARGVAGEVLGPVQLIYNESSLTPPVDAGVYEVRASYPGSENYTAAESDRALLMINRAVARLEVSSTPVFYTGYPRSATVWVRGVDGEELYPYTVFYNGTTSPPVNAGAYALGVQFDGNANYGPMANSTTWVINKATPLMGTGPATYTYDGQPHGISANVLGARGEWLTPIEYTYNGSATQPANAGVYTAVARYPGSTNYTEVSQTTTLTIVQVTPQVTWSTPSAITYGTPLSSTQLNAGTNAAGTFSYSPAPGTVLPAGSHTLTAVFTPADTVNVASVTKSVTLTVNKANPAVTWPAPADVVYGTALGATQLNAAANVPGTFVYSPPVGTVLNAGAHALSVTFTPDDTANYTVANTSRMLTVTAAPSVLTWPTPADIVYGTALGGDQLNATATVPGSFSYSPVAGTVPAAGAATLSVTFTPSDGNYAPASATVSLNVLKATPTLNWPAPAGIGYGTSLGAAQLNATASVGGSFAYSPSAGAVLGAGSHTLSVTFTPYDTANYEVATATATLVVAKAASVITWPRPYDITWPRALNDFDHLHARANVPGTFVYTPALGTVLEPGVDQVLSVVFTPDDSANYLSATATTLITVLRSMPFVNWPPPATITYGTPLSAVQLNATSAVEGTFEYSPAAGTILDAGSHTLTLVFTPTDQTHYTTNTWRMGLTVFKRMPQIAWTQPASIMYGTPLGAAQLNATADVAGTFTYTPSEWTILEPGVHTLSVSFMPADTANYYTYAAATTTVTVARATPSITWPQPAGIVYGTALGATQLNAWSSIPGTFAYSPAPGTILGAGVQTLSVTFTPTDPNRYTSATATVTIDVAQASPSTTWLTPASIVYGTALASAQLNATANLPGTFTYSPAAGTVLGAGVHTLSTTFTPDDQANYRTVTRTVTLTVTKAVPAVTWPAPASIVYGTALGAAQLNATADVAGTFTYSPAAGTVLATGTHTLGVTFTPADGTNYSGASATALLTVTPAPLTVTANDASKPFGAPLPAFTATANGFVNGDSMASLAGAMTFATSASAASPVGTYSVTPQGLASPNYAITFATGTLTVVRASTATSVASAPAPSGANQAVTFTAAVAVVAPGAGVPAGVVQFLDGATVLGSASLVNGFASLTTNGLSAGAHNVSATYSGDGSFASSSASAVHTVNPSSTSTTTTLSSSLNPSTVGQSVSFTATVTSPAGGVSGVVEFFDGSTSLGTVTIASGSARLTTAALATGGHAITARFLGNSSLPPSTSAALAQTVQAAGAKTRAATVALVASPSPAALGSEVTLTTTLTGSQRQAPSGSVLFMINGAVVGETSATVTGSVTAQAVLGTNALARGTHNVTVVYLGDGVYRAGTATVALTVN